MLKSSKLFVVLAILALSAGAAMAQVPGAGDPVPLDIGDDVSRQVGGGLVVLGIQLDRLRRRRILRQHVDRPA